MARRLIVSFDGTWSTPDQTEGDVDAPTNVVKLHRSIRKQARDGTKQISKYLSGIGTEWYNKWTEGAFGLGLDKKILEGYKFLIREYQAGDEIYVFGYSRGAYSARSLVGLIRNCGLPKNIDNRYRFKQRVDEAYQIYRTRDEGPDTPTAIIFRASYSQEVTIKFLGVWDTVGALGIPVDSFKWFNKPLFEFHDVQLSSIVENAFHAIAIDEHREPFSATLWSNPSLSPNQKMEQRCFVGAHANVGGGYADSDLSDIALNWMGEKARSCDLDLKAFNGFEDNHNGELRDSYAETPIAFKALYDRYYRPISQSVNGQEEIDESVQLRRNEGGYAPQNL